VIYKHGKNSKIEILAITGKTEAPILLPEVHDQVHQAITIPISKD